MIFIKLEVKFQKYKILFFYLNINPNGELNGSIKLDILSGKDRSEIYYFNGMLNDKIWGTSPDESFFKVYLQIKK